MQQINIHDLMTNTNVGKFLSATDLLKGQRLVDNVYFDGDNVYKFNNIIRHSYTVESESFYDEFYETYIDISNNKIVNIYCDCPAFANENRCKHIGACIIKDAKNLFNQFNNPERISDFLLNKFVNKNTINIKKEVDLELKIDVNSNYWHDFLEPKVSIGETKLYSLNNKIGQFTKIYKEEGELIFGKNFAYNPNLNYFNQENTKIIEAFIKLCNGTNNRYFSVDELKKFLNEISNCHFIYKNYQINGINNGFPIKSNLSKDSDKYLLNFDISNIKNLLAYENKYC